MTTAVSDSSTGGVPDYPVRFTIDRPEKQSRITNFPLGIGFFIRSIILIPHFVILYFFQIAAYLVYFIASIVILFTGRYPEGLFNFFVGYTRWTMNVYSYLLSLFDAYPPFSMDQQPGYPAVLEVDYLAEKSRLLNFPVLGLFIKFLLTIPHLIILFFLSLVAMLVVFIAQFAILFTGSFPAGMHGFVTGVGRWYTRVQGYTYALTDRYPPFSMD
jgi:hypothetical protein